jgi:hypothetical protein
MDAVVESITYNLAVVDVVVGERFSTNGCGAWTLGS